MQTPVATKRAFIGPIVKVLQGVVSAQAIAFLALPILTRQFSPEAFGHFQIFQSVSAFILVFSSMRYEVALLRAESDEEFAAVARLCLYLCVGASAATVTSISSRFFIRLTFLAVNFFYDYLWLSYR